MAGLAHRRPLIWLVTLGWCLVASGIPLPVSGVKERGGWPARRVAKDRSRPFPCMDSPCGCASAQQCLTSCCCHTPAERLVWARRCGLEVAVLEALERLVAPAAPPECIATAEGTCTASAPAAEAASPCCSNGAAGGAASARGTADSHDTGGAMVAVDTPPHSGAGQPDPTGVQHGKKLPAGDEPGGGADRSTPVVLRAMLACQGVALDGVSVAIPLPTLPVRPCGDTLIVSAATPRDRFSGGQRDRPEPPPPRSGAV